MQELATGSKSADSGVRNAMLRALYEVIRKAGGNMAEVSITTIVGLISSENSDADGRHSIRLRFFFFGWHDSYFLRSNQNR